jgi:hypothetical protein
MPTTYKAVRTIFTCHLWFPSGAQATKANICTRPIAISNTQKAHLWPSIRLDQITNKASTEMAAAQELYRIAKELTAEMTLASSLEISDFSNTITSIGALLLRKMIKVNIKEARRKLMPLHIERIIEPAFSILVDSL